VTTNIIIAGAMGKMGREIAALVLSDPACALAGCIETSSHPSIGRDYSSCSGLPSEGVVLSGTPDGLPLDGSVVVDFTSPQATMTLLSAVEGADARFVVGTTGLSEEETSRIRAAARRLPIVLSPNMSLGVNLLFVLTELAAKKLGETFDIEIVEAHHRLKKDAPSGTARKLGEIAAAAIGVGYDEAVRNGRAGFPGERTRKEIGMHAVRGGDIVGDHTVLFAAMGERLELRHVMHSRTTLARGAVAAAKWVASRGPGLYSMRDILGL